MSVSQKTTRPSRGHDDKWQDDLAVDALRPVKEDRPKGDVGSSHLSDIPEKAKLISRDRNQVGAAGGW